MKIAVKDIEPNPYRNLKKYPLSRSKIEGLMVSFKEAGYHGGLLARKHPTKSGKYQIAFGHHRLQALKDMKIEYASDTAVHELSDDMMHKKMFVENHETWGARPCCVLENVEAARNRLNSVLAKYDTLEEMKLARESTSQLFSNQQGFANAKRKDQGLVGEPTISKYLCNMYSENEIRTAIEVLKETDKPDGDIDINAVKVLPKLSHVRHFRSAVKKYDIPKKKQVEIAKQIVEEGVGRRGVAPIVAKHSTKPIVPEPDKPVLEIKRLLENIDSQACTLHNNIMSLRKKMKQMGIEELKGAKVWLAGSALKRLFNEMKRLIKE